MTAGSPRILIVRIGAMGDVLHALPAVAALRAQMPQAHIGWAIESRWASLLEAATPQGSALVDRVHRVPVRQWKSAPLGIATVKSILALRRELRAETYDIVVDLQGTIRSSLVGWLAGAKIYAGSARPREGPAAIFYTQKIAPQMPHVVEQACEILGAAVGAPLPPSELVLAHNADADAWCDTLFAALPAIQRSKVVVLSAGGGWGAKRWPPERFGAVAAALHARGYAVMVAAAGPDDAQAQQVFITSGHTAQLVVSDMQQLRALLRRAALCIAGDTGPLHMAAALGTPVVGIYGPTDPVRNGPYAVKRRILRNAASATDHSRHAAVEAGLLRISVEDVIDSSMELLENPQ